MKKVWPGFFLILLVSYTGYSQNTQKLNDRELEFTRALDLFEKHKYNSARSAFQEYENKYSDGERKIEAGYYEALSGLYLFHPDGVNQLITFQKEYPDHPLSGRINYDLGSYYFQKDQFKEASQYLRNVDYSQLNKSEKLESQFKLAYAYFTLQEFDEAAPFFNGVKGGNNKYGNAAYYYSGIIAYKKKKYSQAESDFNMCATDKSYAGLIPELLANIYYKMGDYDKLEKIGQEVLNSKNVKNRSSIYLILGDAYYQRENYSKAFEYFESYNDKNSSLPEAEISYRIGFSAFQMGKYDFAIPYFDQAAFKGNDSLIQLASYYLGRVHLRSGNTSYAEAAFQKAAQFNFNKDVQEESKFAQAKILFDSKLRAQSIAPLQSYITDYPKGKYLNEANQYLSEAFLTSNNFDAAISHIEALGTSNRLIEETYQKVTFYKGVELFNDRSFDLAIQLFDKSLSKSYSDNFTSLAHYWKGESYSILQNNNEAINSYAAVFRIEKDQNSEIFLKTRYGIAYAYFNTQQYTKALPHFKTYTSQLQNASDKMYYVDALVRLADCYLVLKDNDKAFDTYLAASKVYPEMNFYIFFRLGVVSWFKGNKEEAQLYLNRVIKDYSSSRYFDDALFESANIDFENGDFNKAVSGFTKLIEKEDLSPYLPYAYLNRGISYTNLNKSDLAVNDYRKILDSYASHKTAVDAITGLQEALRSIGRDSEYESDKKKFALANPESDALVSLEFEGARNKYFSSQYQKAIEELKNYLKEYGKNQYFGDANYYLGESYYLLNQKDSALKYHQEVLKSTNTNFLNKSILRTGDIQYEQAKYKLAIPNFNLLQHLARTRNEEIFAWQGLMLSHFGLKEYDTAMTYALLITERGEAAFGARNKALLYLGKSALALKKYDQADDYFKQCVDAGNDINAAESFYSIAAMRSSLGDYEKSNEMAIDLIAQYSQYPKWNDAAFLLIAENFYQMGEYFQARSTLESIINNSPDEKTVSAAKLQLTRVEEKEIEVPINDFLNDSIE